MSDDVEFTDEQENEFQKIMAIKESLLFLMGPLLPIQSLMILNMSIVDILTASAKKKQAALDTIDMIADTAKKNIEEIDKIGAGNWNNNTLQ